MKIRCNGHKGNNRNAKHEKHMKIGDIKGGFKEDVDRSTLVSSKQNGEKIGSTN